MNNYEEKLKKFISDNNISAEHLSFRESCHSVEDAAKVVHASIDDFVKNICMIDSQDNLIVAIVKGEDRVSTTRVGEVLGVERPRIASIEEVLHKTGYPAGGTPSFGYKAIFLIDPKITEKDIIYSGGGSEYSLVKIFSEELQKANKGKVVRIRK